MNTPISTFAFMIKRRMKTLFWLHNLLCTGVAVLLGTLSSKDFGGDMSWTPRELSRQFALVAFVECWSPFTNTLLLPHDEVSISLWDLYKLGGLLIAVYLMDEIVPLAECLSSSLGKKERIPDYTGPSTAEGDQVGSSSLPCYPRGYIPTHGSHSADRLRVFASLGVASSLVGEVYYAAFLSCWLCTFVLPLDVTGSIHPSVFKMASCMCNDPPQVGGPEIRVIMILNTRVTKSMDNSF
ncbi:hypothetical protein LIER_27143 [Lithospermum erythrorhizon]|uniref:Transmembrane protein n=1 Tax=Lithospermum erythrorhizon TaxID=34254 RepID=A0AAV3REY3_LITER